MRQVSHPARVGAGLPRMLDRVPEAQDDGSTPDPSLPSHTDNDDSVIDSDSSMTSDFSQKSDDDSSISSSCAAGRCCTHNNQIDSTTAMELQDLHDLKFLHHSVLGLRDARWEFYRLNWDEHGTQHEHEGLFTNEYLMSQSAHKKLVRMLDPFLQRFEYNSRGPEPILVEHIIVVGLQVLSGGRPKDQRHIIGSSRAAAYLAVDDFVDAVNLAPELNIDLPTTPEEWEEIYEQYKMKSSNEIIAGCVGAIDGFFLRTNKPTSKEVGNVIAYYSGHYESYGLNCQACVRADLQFMYFGVISPGSTNDNISYPNATALKNAFDSLPLG